MGTYNWLIPSELKGRGGEIPQKAKDQQKEQLILLTEKPKATAVQRHKAKKKADEAMQEALDLFR